MLRSERSSCRVLPKVPLQQVTFTCIAVTAAERISPTITCKEYSLVIVSALNYDELSSQRYRLITRMLDSKMALGRVVSRESPKI